MYGYGAYGTKDQQWKGLVGLKYIWNRTRWTKTSLALGSDYDFIIDQDDEPDKDNLLNSYFRKNLPFSRIYVRQGLLKHEQYLSNSWSSKLALTYKAMTPAFRLGNHMTPLYQNKPADSTMPPTVATAEASVAFRYAPREKTTFLNYDKINVNSYAPILLFSYAQGFKISNQTYSYQKLYVSVEQHLRLPPKAIFYYRVGAGKVFGTVPYLLLNVPNGSEFYVSSRYQFNTMLPYEFAADQFLSFHSRLQTSGLLFNRIPGVKKLGWRERFSYSAYWGSVSNANIKLNDIGPFSKPGNIPFMEAGAGVENILHVLSIEYFRRLTYLQSARQSKGGIFVGVTLFF